MVPKTTTPLTKSIRTLEGWLVIAANVVLVVVPIVTTALPPELAAKLAAGLDAVYAISRGIVKAFSTAPQALAPPFVPVGYTSTTSAGTIATVPSAPEAEYILAALARENVEGNPPTEEDEPWD